MIEFILFLIMEAAPYDGLVDILRKIKRQTSDKKQQSCSQDLRKNHYIFGLTLKNPNDRNACKRKLSGILAQST